MNTVTVHDIYENDWYEIDGNKLHDYIEGSTNMGIVFKHFAVNSIVFIYI